MLFLTFVLVSIPALASADVPSGPSCKCETGGASSRGSAAAALVVAVGSLVVVGRRRQNRR